MPSRRTRPPLLNLRLTVWRCRHLLLTAGLLGVGAVVVHTLAPPPPETIPVVVAAQSLDRGQVLAAADLAVRDVPPDLAPESSVSDPARLIGRSTGSTIPEGLPVVDALLAGGRFGADPPAGTVVVAVMLGAGTADTLLRAGDTVDLVAPATPGANGSGTTGPAADGTGDPGTPADLPLPRTLAHGALVVQVGGTDADASSLLSGTTAATSPTVTLVAVSAQEGRTLAAAAEWGPLGAVLVG